VWQIQNALPDLREPSLNRLRLGGSVSTGLLKFELEGNLLARDTYPIPLFGAPGHVRIEQATEGGKPAAIGFEGDHYYLATSARHFTLKGSLALDDDRVLSIPGPLNTLEADLGDGRCVEGSRLSGLSAVTIHFDRAIAKQPTLEPTVFNFARGQGGRGISFSTDCDARGVISASCSCRSFGSACSTRRERVSRRRRRDRPPTRVTRPTSDHRHAPPGRLVQDRRAFATNGGCSNPTPSTA
jgi:hypothetical protein